MAGFKLKWETPPRQDAPRRQAHRHTSAVAELRKRPGKWAVVATYKKATSASSMAYQVRTGRNVTYAPAGAFQALSRAVGQGDAREYRLYVRYVGEEKADE